MEDFNPSSRRRHDADLKARVLVECAKPGESVAKVTLAPSDSPLRRHRRPARCCCSARE